MIRSIALVLLLELCRSALGQSGVPTSPKNEASGLSPCTRPVSVDFGKMGLDFPSAPAFVTITNCGKVNVVIDRVSITHSSEFTYVDSCPLRPLALAPGAACAVGVRFSPHAKGARKGDLLISAEGHTINVRLTGKGVASTTTLSSTQLVFLPQLLGTQGQTGIARIRNGSAEHSLHIDSVTVEGAFILVPTLLPCAVPGELGASMTCNIAVSFAPRSLGSLDGHLIINDSDPASPHVIGLHGTGKGIEIVPTQLTWNRTAVGAIGEPKEFSIRAVGDETILIKGIETHGDFENHNSCGKELRAGTSCTVTVTFRPTKSGKTAGTVSIVDSDPTKAQSVFLSGTGGIAALLPSTLVFQPQETGTTSSPQKITLQNHGNDTFSISSIDVGGDFVVPSKTCGESLAPGQSCTISVTFSPTRRGTAVGFAEVHESADRIPVKVILTGTGT